MWRSGVLCYDEEGLDVDDDVVVRWWREKMEVYGERGFGEDEGGSSKMVGLWRLRVHKVGGK